MVSTLTAPLPLVACAPRATCADRVAKFVTQCLSACHIFLSPPVTWPGQRFFVRGTAIRSRSSRSPDPCVV
ncbi:unnamed protein product, partial [Iphiclides podalirius]